jgi:hypothetical protein
MLRCWTRGWTACRGYTRLDTRLSLPPFPPSLLDSQLSVPPSIPSLSLLDSRVDSAACSLCAATGAARMDALGIRGTRARRRGRWRSAAGLGTMAACQEERGGHGDAARGGETGRRRAGGAGQAWRGASRPCSPPMLGRMHMLGRCWAACIGLPSCPPRRPHARQPYVLGG